jgi:DNA-binding XRE family transcriptional regulator
MTDSHSEKINEWILQLKRLGSKPIVRVLEECTEDNLDEKEKEWIKKSCDSGCYLLNVAHNHVSEILLQKEYKFEDDDIMRIAEAIKTERNSHNLTQEDLCALTGMSRPTLSMIEKGNKKALFYNIKKLLNVLGYEITIKKIETNGNSTDIVA